VTQMHNIHMHKVTYIQSYNYI